MTPTQRSLPIPQCPNHHVPLLCPACLGSARSAKKAAAARANGLLGGRRKTLPTKALLALAILLPTLAHAQYTPRYADQYNQQQQFQYNAQEQFRQQQQWLNQQQAAPLPPPVYLPNAQWPDVGNCWTAGGRYRWGTGR